MIVHKKRENAMFSLKSFCLKCTFFSQICFQLANRHTDLFHRVTFAHGNRFIFQAVKVHRDAIRCSNLVLSAVAFADIARQIIIHHKVFQKVVVDPFRLFRQLLLQRQNGCLEWCQCRWQNALRYAFRRLPALPRHTLRR